nr:hypothetical protein [Tanacetum cinerariifolium]
MDHVTKHNSMQGTNDHKQKFDDRRTFNNNSNCNNDHHQVQNRRQETLRAYAATSTENNKEREFQKLVPKGKQPCLGKIILAKGQERSPRRERSYSTVRVDFRNCEWARPTGIKLTRENLKSGIKKQNLITNIENAVFDLVIMKLLSPFFIDEGVLVSLITKLIQLI